ncbi:MAG: adenosylmethionine decarboxylase [Myxococcales bacterium]|nr:adenosylmethionine decarboxylase [Myxococcales bacterium]
MGSPANIVLGRQWLIECDGVAPAFLDDATFLEQLFVAAAQAAGATVLRALFHRFEPQGVSGVVILAESHLTVHTWPEYRYAAVDLFSCSDRIRVEPVVTVLRTGLCSEDIRVMALLPRGVVERTPCPLAPEPVLSWRARHEALAPAMMHLSVDVEGCPATLLSSDSVSALLTLVSAALGGLPVDPPLLREVEGICTLLTTFSGGHLTAQLSPSEGTARIDLLAGRFVDPVPLALQLRKLLGGRHHALSCQFRG